jgi:uncharacterized membrane protein YphA (DoxX/SURF4 family)
LVGLVFLSQGIQKFISAGANGSGRFETVAIPYPEFFGPLVGATEIFCGSLLVIGICTRIATLPLLIIIGTVIYTTKLPLLLQKGFWPAVHEGRADFYMLMDLIFLLNYGAGRYSADSKFNNG